jgi:hypothetical protein
MGLSRPVTGIALLYFFYLRRSRVFENRVLRRIFGPRTDEVTGEWRKLHNKELHNFYTSPITVVKSRRMREVHGMWQEYGDEECI